MTFWIPPLRQPTLTCAQCLQNCTLYVKAHTVCENYTSWFYQCLTKVIHDSIFSFSFWHLPLGDIDLRGWSGNIGDGLIKVGASEKLRYIQNLACHFKMANVYSMLMSSAIFFFRAMCTLVESQCATTDGAVRRPRLPVGENSHRRHKTTPV